MANSFITRCPKCSTAFRVSDEVLSMAKGKVRCGQCFHIFDAGKLTNPSETVQKNQESRTTVSATKEHALANTLTETERPLSPPRKQNTINEQFSPADDVVNPDWLHTLFDDEDLYPLGEKKKTTPTPSNKVEEPNNDDTRPLQANNKPATAESTAEAAPKIEQPRQAETPKQNQASNQNEPAPWEVELAEVEAALKSFSNTSKTTQTPPTPTQTPTNLTATPKATAPVEPTMPAQEPDYMVALHSLAQTASEQARPSDIKSQHSILEQLSAQQSLAPLLGESEPASHKKKSHPWLWFFASLLGIAILSAQVAMHFFDEGSRSSSFRPIYRTLCSYTGCTLPGFEDTTAITIQHVRIQSHPTLPNTLLVNAIITNTSDFSQPMPKIALEFFDLNGLPVAARLFAPNDYLHKDFLDITYMPPNTPIHLVIPIQDPGARAVTHQLRAFPSDTRSY